MTEKIEKEEEEDDEYPDGIGRLKGGYFVHLLFLYFFQERDWKLLLSWWEGCSRMGRGLTRGARPCIGRSGEAGQVPECKANVMVFQHYFKP